MTTRREPAPEQRGRPTDDWSKAWPNGPQFLGSDDLQGPGDGPYASLPLGLGENPYTTLPAMMGGEPDTLDTGIPLLDPVPDVNLTTLVTTGDTTPPGVPTIPTAAGAAGTSGGGHEQTGTPTSAAQTILPVSATTGAGEGSVRPRLGRS